ncbi:ATP-binding cassette domain-containing protein [uncultured Helcococcus sp.]|uniref:ABC transporter ATP-binding protein n=1 Tax=uncultured Helcococcus sp. TaxID=1072508 RepID=UPI00260CC9A8|nr:ATP-binding cassette domain-containing protein [uncultured Helcococcus sp.]
MLELKNISKIFNKDYDNQTIILNQADFKVNKGDKILISGENGIGKTSLLKILATYDLDFEGTYLINGKDVKEMSEGELAKIRNEMFGFIFQDYFLLEDESTKYNIEIPLLYSKKYKFSEKKERFDKLIDEFELNKKLRQAVKTMSGGERQKVAICRAIINDPEILILDEPTAALNPRFKEKFYEYIFTNIKDETTLILVSHDTRYFDSKIFKEYKFVDGKLYLS